MSLLTAADRDFFLKILDAAPVKRPIEDIAAWVEGRRMLPPSTPIPGPWRNKVTPYGIEIMNSLSPNSGIERTVVMKCRKVGFTTIFENVAVYYILECPSEILYATASEELARDWGDHKIMAAIESLGGLDRITANTTSAKSRRTGNTSDKKEYIGGQCDIMSSQSKRARRQLDKRVLLIDEIDGVEAVTATGEGKWTEILFGHTASWGTKRKIAMFGSPTVFETSLTNEYYQQGDCRRFMVPCPYCGEPIELRLNIDSGASFGLKAETKAGEIIGAYYLCENCGEPIRNEQKLEMYSDRPRCLKRPEKEIEKYRWEPTKKPEDSAWRSYHLNALYSPIGMLTFTDVAKARAKAEAGDHVDMRSYVNIYMGQPFKDTGQRPKIEKVIGLRGDYNSGTVPKEALFLTMTVDVQRGSAKDENNPPRLELEIMGVGKNYRSFSILYKRFLGETGDPFSGAWEKLDEWSIETKLTFMRTDGVPLQVQIIGVDSGDQPDVVYRYCERLPNTFPLKGFGNIKAGKKEKGDLPGGFRRYRASRLDNSDKHVLEVNTWHYKTQIYSRLKIERQAAEPQKKGFCSFPKDYPDEYFEMLTGEEKHMDGSFHPIRARVEALDCRVYNSALEDFYLETQVQGWRAKYQSIGWSGLQLQTIDTMWVLDFIENHPNLSYLS